jgi:single-stranded DNA-binding protein
MFFDLVMFGRSAELVRDNTDKGSLIIASGRLEEDTSVSQKNGQTYVNKRIVCDNVQVGVKPVQVNQAPQVPVQPAAPQQYQQPMGYAQAPVQYAQPQYQAPAQQPGSPW